MLQHLVSDDELVRDNQPLSTDAPLNFLELIITATQNTSFTKREVQIRGRYIAALQAALCIAYNASLLIKNQATYSDKLMVIPMTSTACALEEAHSVSS